MTENQRKRDRKSKRKETILRVISPSANLSHEARLSRMHHEEVELALSGRGD